MRVCLVYIPPEDNTDGCYILNPLIGPYLLAGILRDKGYEVEVFDNLCFLNEDYSELVKKIAEYDVVGISLLTLSWYKVRKFCDDIKELNPHIRIVVGGPHTVYYDGYILENSKADAVIRGEGERTFLRYLEGKTGNGMTIRLNSEIIRYPDAEYLSKEEFKEYYKPAYDLIKYKFPFLAGEFSRGCWNNCLFCSVLYRNRWRCMADVDTVIESYKRDINLAGNMVKVKDAWLLMDNLLNGDIRWATEVLERIAAEGLRIGLACDVLAFQDEGFLKAFRNSKIIFCTLGIECGYDEGLQRLGKKFRIKDIEEIAPKIAGVGEITSSFIIGFPWETKIEAEKTLRFARYLRKYDCFESMNWWIPLPSRLWFNREKYRIKNVDESIWDGFYSFKNPFHSEWNTGVFLKTHPGISQKDYEYLEKIKCEGG
ncbi:MAG: cobalamin-dependent protein [Elusimicrobiota bacterium]